MEVHECRQSHRGCVKKFVLRCCFLRDTTPTLGLEGSMGEGSEGQQQSRDRDDRRQKKTRSTGVGEVADRSGW
jgi:hypothetical protein